MSSWITSVAPVITALGSLSGVGAAIYVSVRTRREVRADRQLRVLPILAFKPNAAIHVLERRKFGHRIGGINPEVVEELFENISEEVTVNDLPGAYGAQGLANHGQGPAFMIEVTWVAKHITLDTESFELDAKKQKEAKYCRALNSMPASPGHLAPGEVAALTRIPTFLILDPCKQVKEIEGDVEISYRDAFGKHWETVQEFRIIPQYGEKESRCVCIFTDIKRLPTIQ